MPKNYICFLIFFIIYAIKTRYVLNTGLLIPAYPQYYPHVIFVNTWNYRFVNYYSSII